VAGVGGLVVAAHGAALGVGGCVGDAHPD
jgi:hypothetical protein